MLATPEERRPWVPVGDGHPHPRAGPGAAGDDLPARTLIRAMQRTPATEYLLVEPDGAIFGVLVTADVDRAFAAAL